MEPHTAEKELSLFTFIDNTQGTIRIVVRHSISSTKFLRGEVGSILEIRESADKQYLKDFIQEVTEVYPFNILLEKVGVQPWNIISL